MHLDARDVFLSYKNIAYTTLLNAKHTYRNTTRVRVRTFSMIYFRQSQYNVERSFIIAFVRYTYYYYLTQSTLRLKNNILRTYDTYSTYYYPGTYARTVVLRTFTTTTTTTYCMYCTYVLLLVLILRNNNTM